MVPQRVEGRCSILGLGPKLNGVGWLPALAVQESLEISDPFGIVDQILEIFRRDEGTTFTTRGQLGDQFCEATSYGSKARVATQVPSNIVMTGMFRGHADFGHVEAMPSQEVTLTRCRYLDGGRTSFVCPDVDPKDPTGRVAGPRRGGGFHMPGKAGMRGRQTSFIPMAWVRGLVSVQGDEAPATRALSGWLWPEWCGSCWP